MPGGIADLQAGGIADREVDPMIASRALSSMVSRLAYSVFALGEGADEERPLDFEDLVFTVTRLWANALGFPEKRSVGPGGRCFFSR